MYDIRTMVDVRNTLTKEQKKELSEKIEILMMKYESFELGSTNEKSEAYFSGVIAGMNNIYKLVNEIDDDYNSTL